MIHLDVFVFEEKIATFKIAVKIAV